MKAKEYYNTYGLNLLKEQDARPDGGDFVQARLLRDLFAECTFINAMRNGRTEAAMMAIYREQNDKWNAIIRLFEKDGHVSPLIWNNFMTKAKELYPEKFEKPKPTDEPIMTGLHVSTKVLAAVENMEKLQKDVEWVLKAKERDLKNAKFV